MFAALDTESCVSLQRNQERLRRSERIHRHVTPEAARPRAPFRAFVAATARTIIEACPVLRVAFPPGAAGQLSTDR
jgi:hypothetical protein